jgi:hypothetical protein
MIERVPFWSRKDIVGSVVALRFLGWLRDKESCEVKEEHR